MITGIRRPVFCLNVQLFVMYLLHTVMNYWVSKLWNLIRNLQFAVYADYNLIGKYEYILTKALKYMD